MPEFEGGLPRKNTASAKRFGTGRRVCRANTRKEARSGFEPLYGALQAPA
jgi:hypothetical protein